MSEKASPYYSACDVCRTRKFKCTKERPTCSPCLQLGLQCKYSLKVSRTALTRSNLTTAEDRVQELEAAFAALFPGVELDTLLLSVGFGASKDLEDRKVKKTPAGTPQHGRDSGSPSEALPRDADGFDWAEGAASVNELSDGMAALSVDPEGAGYLGATSSVVPLRAMLIKATAVPQEFGSPSDWPGHIFATNQIPQSLNFTNISESTFVDAYFRVYHLTYPFLHEPSFRAQFNGTSSRPEGHSWPILLNSVLTLGAWCIGNDSSVIDDFFYQKIVSLSEERSIFETGNLALVQALLLLSNYTQKCNRPNTGWNYLGLAVRMALSLGLHKEFPNWQITLLQREMRRRVWWGLFIFDSGASITFGRPVLLPEAGIMDAGPVLNIHEESLTSETVSLPLELASPTIYTALISQSLFHAATNSLHHRLISSPAPTPQELLKLNTKIISWEESIPSFFQVSSLETNSSTTILFARYRLEWRSWNLQILLFRPVILQWAASRRRGQDGNSVLETPNGMAEELECRKKCFASAQATINSISDFVAAGATMRLSTWYMLYFLFQAGLVPIICLSSDPTSEDSTIWLGSILTTKDLLTRTAVNNQLASRCLTVFDQLCSPLVGVGQTDLGMLNTGLWEANFENFPYDPLDGTEFWDWTNDAMNWTL